MSVPRPAAGAGDDDDLAHDDFPFHGGLWAALMSSVSFLNYVGSLVFSWTRGLLPRGFIVVVEGRGPAGQQFQAVP